MIAIVDASVAVKWFVDESGHEDALQLLESDIVLHAPDLIVAELANVLWLKVKRKQIPSEQALTTIENISSFLTSLIPSVNIVRRALQLADALDHPAYDCLYLAAAGRSASKLVTADRRLVARLRNSPYETLAVDLAEWRAARARS